MDEEILHFNRALAALAEKSDTIFRCRLSAGNPSLHLQSMAELNVVHGSFGASTIQIYTLDAVNRSINARRDFVAFYVHPNKKMLIVKTLDPESAFKAVEMFWDQ